MRYIIFCFLFICSFSFSGNIPLKDSFHSIKRLRCTSNFDCSNKAWLYATALESEGYSCNIVIVKTRRLILHAIVKCGDMYYDPTFGFSSKNLSRFGKYRFSISLKDAPKWGGEFVCDINF